MEYLRGHHLWHDVCCQVKLILLKLFLTTWNIQFLFCFLQVMCCVPVLMETLWGRHRQSPNPNCTDVFARSGKHLHLLPRFHQRTHQIWRAHCSGVRCSVMSFYICVQISKVTKVKLYMTKLLVLLVLPLLNIYVHFHFWQLYFLKNIVCFLILHTLFWWWKSTCRDLKLQISHSPT